MARALKYSLKIFSAVLTIGLFSAGSTQARAADVAAVMGQPDLDTDFVQLLLQDRQSYRLSRAGDIEITTELYSILARRNVQSISAVEVISDGSTDMMTLTQGLKAAAQKSPVVLNILGGGENEVLCKAMAADTATAYVWVAGASGMALDPSVEPSCSSGNILRVAAYDQSTGRFPTSSNFGGSVRVAAPGVKIRVQGPFGRESIRSGGSVAAAFVAAQLAVFAREHENLRGAELVTEFLSQRTRHVVGLEPYVQGGLVLDDTGL